jgi:mono/diheme cytochrome c family protein
MKRVFTVLCFVPGLLFAAAAGDAAKGKDLYAAKCKSCHGAAGEGNQGMAKAMKVELRPLGSKDVQAKKDDELKKVVTDGTGKMKAIAGVVGTDLDNVIAFLRTLKQ